MRALDDGAWREFSVAPDEPAVAGDWAAVVLYPADADRIEATRRLLTSEVAARLAAGADAQALATGVGAQAVRPLSGLPGWQVFSAASPTEALALADRLAAQPGVSLIQPQLARKHARKLVPNDTYFWQQWHLRNTGLNLGVAGMDIGVTNVWDTWRGSGVVIGVVDDGIQETHPDLSPNYSAVLSTNLNAGPFNPFYDYHGTLVAGAAAARGNNAIGGAGAAYEATLASIRLLSEYTTDATDAAAMLHRNDAIQVKNNSWGAPDSDGVSPSTLGGPGPLTAAALATGTSQGRGGLGTVYVFAGGDGGAYGEDANTDGYANSVNVIAAGAVDDRGQQSTFSEPGACLTVCAPSGSGAEYCFGGRQRIITTDLLGQDGLNWQFASCELSDRDYTQNFTGTSTSAALVSGVVALMLQANPQLGWRDVKEILLRSATRVNPTDSGWATNTAGIATNPKFGGGLVNALAAVQLATNWVKLRPQETSITTLTNLALAVPDNNPAGVTQIFTVTDTSFRVEQVRLSLWLPHAKYGDLEVNLTSPSGITSRLVGLHNTTGTGYSGWAFSSVRNWGESAAGTWTLKVADLRAGNAGTLQAATLELLGTSPQITGQVQLEGFTGPIVGGVGQGGSRAVTFLATSNYFNGVATVTNQLRSWTNTLTFNGSGVASFTLSNVHPTTMFLSAKTAWNLRRKLPVVLSNGVATVNFTVSSRLAAGDIAPATRDNKVNTLDRNVLLSQWGKPAPGNAAADLNGDGLVNTIDRNRLLSNWGTEGAAP